MDISDQSLGFFLARVEGQPIESAIRFQYAKSHAERLRLLREVLDSACNQLERNRHLKQDLSEDQLTIEICQAFSMLGFQVAHDEQVGGHCDIVIKASRNFVWMAEAKIHSSYVWLEKGFKQLSARYSTGVSEQDNADMIVYCRVSNSLSVLSNWKERLVDNNDDVQVYDFNNGGKLEFWSKHDHVATGLPFTIRHKIVSLYFKPTDK